MQWGVQAQGRGQRLQTLNCLTQHWTFRVFVFGNDHLLQQFYNYSSGGSATSLSQNNAQIK